VPTYCRKRRAFFLCKIAAWRSACDGDRLGPREHGRGLGQANQRRKKKRIKDLERELSQGPRMRKPQRFCSQEKRRQRSGGREVPQ